MIDDQNPTWADYNVSSFLIIESEDSHILEAESVTGVAPLNENAEEQLSTSELAPGGQKRRTPSGVRTRRLEGGGLSFKVES